MAVSVQAQLAYYEFNNSLISSDSDSNSTASLLSLTGLGTTPVYDTTRGTPAPSLKLTANLIPAAIDLNKYLQFTVTAASGLRLNLTSLSFSIAAIGTSTYRATWQVRSSLDNYAASLGSGSVINNTTFTTATVDLSASRFDALQAISFRLYFSDNSNNSARVTDIDRINLAGTTEIPEPHEWALLMAAALGGFALHRRSGGRSET